MLLSDLTTTHWSENWQRLNKCTPEILCATTCSLMLAAVNCSGEKAGNCISIKPNYFTVKSQLMHQSTGNALEYSCWFFFFKTSTKEVVFASFSVCLEVYSKSYEQILKKHLNNPVYSQPFNSEQYTQFSLELELYLHLSSLSHLFNSSCIHSGNHCC